jgi:hypothetical protein
LRILAIIGGLVYALICEFIAILVGGAGHGWVTPFFFGLSGIVLFPFVFWATMVAKDSGQTKLATQGIAAAVVIDVLIFFATISEGIEYFERVGAFAWLWILFWLAGQAPLLWAISVKRDEGS